MKIKSKRIKRLAISLCVLLVIGTLGVFAGAFRDTISSYKALDENQFSEKLSGMDPDEIFDEVNKLSNEGVEYPALGDFAFALLENIERTPNRILINAITNKNNHPNLRKMCMELLDTKNEGENGTSTLTDREGKKLEAVLLDENEDQSVRFYLIDVLPENDSTINALKTVIEQEDKTVSERALQILNYFAPEHARPIAEELIQSKKDVALGISTINYQMRNSKNNAEKDEWVKYLVTMLNEVNAAPAVYTDKASDSQSSEDTQMKEFLITMLEQMRYSTALYAVIDSSYIPLERKVSIISDEKSAISAFEERLASSPTDYDIEMIMKAIDIAPVASAKLIEPLKLAVKNSEHEYNIDKLSEKVNSAIAAAK